MEALKDIATRVIPKLRLHRSNIIFGLFNPKLTQYPRPNCTASSQSATVSS